MPDSQPMMIGPLVVDVYLTEAYSLSSETSDYPRESDTNVTDNTRALPLELKVEGFISDAPLGQELIERRERETGGTQAPSEFAYAQLEKIHTDELPVTVVTSLRSYGSMIMTTCEVARDKDTGKALSFSASFKQITVITNARTQVGSVLNRGFRAARAVYVQAFTDDEGNKENRIIYARARKTGGTEYVYADGSVANNQHSQKLTKFQKADAKGLTLDKNGFYQTRPDQKRAPGKPYGPYVGGGKT